jgi:protein TonB
MRLETYVLAALLAFGSVGAPAQIMSGADGQAPPVAHFPGGTKDAPARVSGGVMASLAQHKVDPIYPEDARDRGIGGAIVLHVIIDQQGKVDKLSVISGPEPLRDASLTAVKQWTYKPYMLNGQPVFVETTVTVNFTHTP